MRLRQAALRLRTFGGDRGYRRVDAVRACRWVAEISRPHRGYWNDAHHPFGKGAGFAPALNIWERIKSLISRGATRTYASWSTIKLFKKVLAFSIALLSAAILLSPFWPAGLDRGFFLSMSIRLLLIWAALSMSRHRPRTTPSSNHSSGLP